MKKFLVGLVLVGLFGVSFAEEAFKKVRLVDTNLINSVQISTNIFLPGRNADAGEAFEGEDGFVAPLGSVWYFIHTPLRVDDWTVSSGYVSHEVWGGVQTEWRVPSSSDYAIYSGDRSWTSTDWVFGGDNGYVRWYYKDYKYVSLPDETTPPNADTKEPINFISGNNHFPGMGVSVPVSGVPLEFSLYYNSVKTNQTAVGRGWRHSYDWSLSVDGLMTTVTEGKARTYTFDRKNQNGEYSPSFDNSWLLAENTNTGIHALTLSGELVYLFDTNGVLQNVSNVWNQSVSLSYSSNELSSAEHSNGQLFDFAWSNGLLTDVSSSNRSLSFAYAPSGVMTQSVRQFGSEQSIETYRYDADLLMTQKVDSVGSAFRYTYATNGFATGMALGDADWYEHTVEYFTSSSRVSYVKGTNLFIHDYTFDPDARRLLEERFAGETITYQNNDSGDVTLKTRLDADGINNTQLSRLYDDRHNITNQAFGLNAAPSNFTSITWHNGQLPARITDPEGFRTEYEYTNGSVALSRIWLSSNQTADTTYTYFTNGLLAAVTNANGNSTAFTYDALGHPESVIPAAGPTVTFDYNPLGHLTKTTLPGGRETDYTVDPLGRVQRIDYADGLHSTFQYNALDKLTNTVGRAGRTTRFEYLPSGKLSAIVRQFGNTNSTIAYDFDQQFNTLSITDPLARAVESYVLDAHDRAVTVTNVEGQTMSIDYLVGDFVDSINRFDGTVVSNAYTGDGFLKSVAYPDETNRFTYLKNGFFQTLENSEGILSNGWNSAGRLTEQTCTAGVSPASSVAYGYDPLGNVTNSDVSIGSNDLTTSYSYDSAERLAGVSQSSMGVSPVSFDYRYNADNGLVESVSNNAILAEYDYDLMDRVESIAWKSAGGSTILSFDYQYNAAGMITNRVVNGENTAYQYDDLDRLTSVSSVYSVVNYSYDLAGNRTSKTKDDFSVSYTLGDGNRLASWSAGSTNNFRKFRTLKIKGSSSEAIGTDDRWGKLYVSNSVAVVPEIDGTNFSIEAFTVGMGTQTVVAAIRDQAGNVGYATNEIFRTVVTNGSYSYNAAGCLTNISYSGTQYAKNTSLAWNSQYQLTSVSSANSVVNYSYDVLGRRVSRVENGATNHFVYDGNQVVADVDTNGVIVRSYLWGSGIDNLLSMTVYGDSTNTYYALKDHLNSVHALVDENGTIIESYEYDAWGRTKVFDSEGTQLAESAIGNRYTFQGREMDWSTGLIYFRARWYSPVTGRWLSKDLIGISGGLNQYVFCGNSPINRVDPFGLVDTNLSGISDADEYTGKWGYYDVAVHGNESGQFTDPGGNSLSVSDVYSQMLADGYEPGTPVNLISCYAGKDGGDAQKLANMANALVNAATETVTLPFKPHLINPKTGQPITNPRQQETTGEWVKRKPCGE